LSVIRCPWAKHSPEITAFHKHSLSQAGEFQKSPGHLALELEPNQKHVSDQGGPDLDEHGILGGAIKSLDLQVLLNPLEKEFYLNFAIALSN
jgi:hypothetical protein